MQQKQLFVVLVKTQTSDSLDGSIILKRKILQQNKSSIHYSITLIRPTIIKQSLTFQLSVCKSAVTLQRMTPAHESVCSYAPIRSHTQLYVRGTLGICRVRSIPADIRRCTSCYTQRRNEFFGHVQNLCKRIAYTLLIR